VTGTLLGVPLRSTVTVLLAPAVCPAELGTVRVPRFGELRLGGVDSGLVQGELLC
jgi:hypothetical protein